MKRLIYTCLAPLIVAPPVQANECVVLLHGLARSELSMKFLEWRLSSLGYNAVSIGYPSASMPIDELAALAVPAGIAACKDASKIHFVTHSMGGILLRQYFEKHGDDLPDNIGRTVMLGPPNKGSEIVDQTSDWPGFELWNGVAGSSLGTEPDSVPNQLGPVDFEVGIIAGTSSVSPFFSNLIEGEDDGKVSVESTKVDGMADHITLPVTHTFMMNDKAVYEQVKAFLEKGRFQR